MATMNLHRYFLILLVVLPLLCGSLSAQEVDKDGEFYLDFAGSAVFRRSGFKAGPGFTAAFGYAFKEGFSTEIEWGYQKAGIGNRIENSSRNIPPLTFSGPDGQVSQPDATIITPVIGLDGEIKTQSLMGNVYYRYPKWRVSPYAGFGLGAFFHDGNIIVTYENECVPSASFCPVFGGGAGPLTLGLSEDSRFAYQLMSGLSVRASPRLEFRVGYRFRSNRRAEIDADLIEAGIRFRL